jgi:hypothetical protein
MARRVIFCNHDIYGVAKLEKFGRDTTTGEAAINHNKVEVSEVNLLSCMTSKQRF